MDLALWLPYLDALDGLRRAKARALPTLWDKAAIGIASHQVDVFIFDPGTDRYLGRLCDFNACPKGKAECRVPGCGDVALLRQYEGFRWRRLDVQPSTSAALTPRIWCFPAMVPDRIKPPSQEGNLRMAGRLTSDCCCPGFERSCFRRSRWIAAVRSWRQLDRGGCGVRQ